MDSPQKTRNNIRKRIILLFLVFFSCLSLNAQIDKDIKDYISSIEDSEISDEEKQTLIEDLFYLYHNPININTADDNSLKTIGLNDFQILCLKRYIKETHPLLSVYEIPLINGFSDDVLKQILPFIYVAPIKIKPSLRMDSIFSKGFHEIRLQYKKVLEKAWGYCRDDGKGFLGDNFSTNLRYNFNYYDRLSFSLVADNDAGEPFFAKNFKKGYDFLSSQLTIKNISIIEQITIGDYRLGFGEGLSINQNLNFGYFSNDARIKKSFSGIKPNRSITEYNYLRGIATKIKLKDFSIYLFGSYKNIDYSGSILTTGLHRTESEISKKDSNTEKVYGTHISWKRWGYELAATLFRYEYKYPITHQNSAYMKYYFEGLNNNIYSLNGSMPLFRKARLYGEFSISKNKGKAALAGVEINLGYKTNLSIAYRYYQNKYQNYFSSAIGAQSRNANERGLYIGLAYLINNSLSFFVAGDLFNFPDISYSASRSVTGIKFKSEINYDINKTNTLTLLAKYNNRPYDEVHTNGEKYPEDNILKQIQIRYSNNGLSWLILNLRLGYSETKTYSLSGNNGGFISQDVIIKPEDFPLSINLRLALFNTDDYDNRFSIYEYSMPLNFYSSQLYDKGLRTYIVVNFKINESMTLAGKYSLTRYQDKTSIHSSNDEINRNHKQEIAFQFHWLINKYKRKKNFNRNPQNNPFL
ncbi:MAG: hypothetical protein H6Q15_1193 [Bacteroidetes bacterium]|nr:hypothetical protein [Bacteroidota bacterium]